MCASRSAPSVGAAPVVERTADLLRGEESVVTVNEEKLNDLLGRFVVDVGGTFQAISAVIGDRLGLYRALLAVMPATPADVAERSRCP